MTRRRLAAVAGALAALVVGLAGPADAGALRRPALPVPVAVEPGILGPLDPEGLVRLAAATLPVHAETYGWRLVVHPTTEPRAYGFAAVTVPETKALEVWARPGLTVDSYRQVIAHELGHVIDFECRNDLIRSWWRALRHVPAGLPWLDPGGEAAGEHVAYPGEDFADATALLITGPFSQAPFYGPVWGWQWWVLTLPCVR